jgi:hypothetical protein
LVVEPEPQAETKSTVATATDEKMAVRKAIILASPHLSVLRRIRGTEEDTQPLGNLQVIDVVAFT